MWIGILLAVVGETGGQELPKPLYSSSVVGTEFDFIRESDPSTYVSVAALGIGESEMPDKTDDAPLLQQAYRFEAKYSDGAKPTFYLDKDFASEKTVRAELEKYLVRFGRLPSVLKRGVERIVVHQGDATAFSDRGLIVVYSQNADKRIGTHDLEETLFHESVHAVWDGPHAGSEKWRAAQKRDDAFVTEYGAKNPGREDMAESALFAVTLQRYPDRIPPADTAAIRKQIPARIAFFEELFPKSVTWISRE